MEYRNRREIAPLMAAAVLWAVGLVGCETSEPKTKVVVPSAATSAPEYEGDGSVPEQRYVIRMSDGERDWEVEFPEVATGYEMHIPLDQRGSNRAIDEMQWEADQLTEADKEHIEKMRREREGMENEGVFDKNKSAESRAEEESDRSDSGQSGDPGMEERSDRESAGSSDIPSGPCAKLEHKRDDTEPAPTRPSYLLGIEKVRQLYDAGKYELAMARITQLEEAYPLDVKLLSMKGTLAVKLGWEETAREAWECVLQKEDNPNVREALKRLNDSE